MDGQKLPPSDSPEPPRARRALPLPPRERSARRKLSGLQQAGAWVIAIGIFMQWFYFMKYDATVSDGSGGYIYNTGRLAAQNNGVIIGSSLIVCGSVILVGGRDTTAF